MKPNGLLKPSLDLFTLYPSDAAQFGSRPVSAPPPLEIYLPVPRFSSMRPFGTYIIVMGPFYIFMGPPKIKRRTISREYRGPTINNAAPNDSSTNVGPWIELYKYRDPYIIVMAPSR